MENTIFFNNNDAITYTISGNGNTTQIVLNYNCVDETILLLTNLIYGSTIKNLFMK